MIAPRPTLLQRLATHWPLLVLLAVTGAAYVPLLSVTFSWDDEALIVDNQVTHDLGNWKEFFTRDLWSTTKLSTLKSGYYRPLMLLSMALDRAVSPWGLGERDPAALLAASGVAHLHSLLWHLLAVGMLYGLANRLLGRWPAVTAATVFALHPLQSEVLALVAARNDSMATALVLAAVWLLVEAQPRWPRLLAAGLLAWLALLSKESAVLAVLMLLPLDLARHGRPIGWRRYVALGAALVAYVPLRRLADLDAAIAPSASSLRLVGEHAAHIVAAYASMLVWPWPLTPARHMLYLPELGALLQGLVVLAGLLAMALWKGDNRKLVLVGLAWAVLTFAPSLAATVDKGLLGERYLSFPLAGLGLAVAAAVPRLPRWAPLVFAVPAIAALQVRLPHWKDSRTVWEHAHTVAPTAFTAGGLAWYYHRDRDFDRANELFVQALEGDPPYRDVCEMIVMSHLEAKDPKAAVEVARWAMTERGCPAEGLLYTHFAVALAGTGQFEAAAKVAANHPRGLHGPGLVVMGAYRTLTGDLSTVYQAAVRMTAEDPAYLDRVAKMLRLGGQPAASEAVLAMKSGPPPAQAPAAPPAGTPAP